MKKKRKIIPKKDFTINDSCLICDVKTDGSILCDKCLIKITKEKIKRDVA